MIIFIQESCTMLDVRVCFDALISQFPGMGSHISSRSMIVANPDFETGIVALQKGEVANFTNPVKKLLKRFELEEPPLRILDDCESLVLQALQNIRNETQGCYVETVGVCPTSNHLERLFSQCKLIRSQLRQAMLPSTMEMILFLKVNRCYWTVLDVERAMNNYNGEDLITLEDEFEEDLE